MKNIKEIKPKMKESNFIKLTQKRGISLITLVITIIVIIILAAAVVMSLNNNNVITNASKARYESDRDYVQSVLELAVQKVVLRHQGAIELEEGPISTAAMNANTTIGEVVWESEELAGLSGKIIFGEGTDTDAEFYTGEELPVYGSETTWYVDEQGKLVLQTGGRIYGAEEVPKAKEYISKTESYVGYYADIDGDGTVDGVIYADLAIGNMGDGIWCDESIEQSIPVESQANTPVEWGRYTIPTVENVKEYYVSKTEYTDDFGTKEVLTAKGKGNERFYVIALDDIDTSKYCWYAAAAGKMTDYNEVTSCDFGKGKQNTATMIKYWNEQKYGAQDANSSYKDMWGVIQEKVKQGWFVPSKEEWAAFGEELGVTSSNYGSFNLGPDYWSSSQLDDYHAWEAHVSGSYINQNGAVDYTYYCVRLVTTF